MAKPKSKTAPKRVIPSTLAPEGKAPINNKVRPSKSGKWRALVLVAVHVLIAIHIAHWLTTGSSITPVEPSEAMAFSRSSIINAGLIFFAAMILLTAVFGRYFCGWGCHLVALQDLCRHWLLKIGIRPRALNSRTLAWVPTLAFLYMFIWPAAYRWWIGDSFAIQGVELTTTHFWETFPGLVIGVLTFLICGFACVYFLGAKGFCTYACPYGAAFAAADRVAPMRIRVTDACEQCGHCTAVCSSNVRVHEEVRDWGMVVSPGCMKCRDCVSVCPKGALYYGAGPIPLFAKPRQPPSSRAPKPMRWGDELILVLAFAISFLVFRGLYGLVPFLMALGVAGVMAFVALTAVKLCRESSVERSGLRLKRAGKLLPQGRAFVPIALLLGLFTAHSAVIRAYDYLGDSAYEQSASARIAMLADPAVFAAGAPESVRRAAVNGLAHLRQSERWGLFESYGNAAKQAWLSALSGDDEGLRRNAAIAAQRNELSWEMHQLLALSAAKTGEHERALTQWEQAIADRPALPEPYLALGLHQAGRGDIFAAQEVFDRGVRAAPRSAELHYNAGLARAILGQLEQSLALFERALELNPEYLEARENLAGVHASLGNFASAISHYRVAVEQAPEDAETRVLLARALLGNDQREEAVEVLREAVKRNPQNAETRKFFELVAGDE